MGPTRSLQWQSKKKQPRRFGQKHPDALFHVCSKPGSRHPDADSRFSRSASGSLTVMIQTAGAAVLDRSEEKDQTYSHDF